MSVFRVWLTMPRNDRRYVVELSADARLRLTERLAALRQAGAIIDFQIEPQWVDPFDAVRLEEYLVGLEAKASR